MWDMHAHALDEHDWAFPLFVANGVTGIREMGTILPYERINEIRRGVAEGAIVVRASAPLPRAFSMALVAGAGP